MDRDAADPKADRDYREDIVVGGALVTFGEVFGDDEGPPRPDWFQHETKRVAVEVILEQQAAGGDVDLGDAVDLVARRIGIPVPTVEAALTAAMLRVPQGSARTMVRAATRWLRAEAARERAKRLLRGSLAVLDDDEADPADVVRKLAERVEVEHVAIRRGLQTLDGLLLSYDPRTEPPEVLYQLGEGGFVTVEIGPGRVLVIAAAPGTGKTALVLQLVIDALRLDPTLRVLVVNVEMSAKAMVDRQLARISGVPLSAIRRRELTSQQADRVGKAIEVLRELGPRIAFAGPPYSLDAIDAAVRRHRPNLLVMDYAQRIQPRGEHASTRDRINAVMEAARGYADAGLGVFVVSAVSRQKGGSGNSGYSGLNMASLRESSEIEYGADDIYLLEPDRDDRSLIHCRHAKSRHGEPTDLLLTFDGSRQSFVATDRFDAATIPFGEAG